MKFPFRRKAGDRLPGNRIYSTGEEVLPSLKRLLQQVSISEKSWVKDIKMLMSVSVVSSTAKSSRALGFSLMELLKDTKAQK